MNFRARDILCVVGIGIVDNSCCGSGGRRFIEIPGYIASWKSETDDAGNLISKVEPINNEEEKRGIKAALDKL